MQIVIEIPKKVYNALTHMDFDANLVVDEMRNSIANGTPLPKGHGRLVECERLQEAFRRNVVGYAGFKQLFDIAPTIIEASKESENIE